MDGIKKLLMLKSPVVYLSKRKLEFFNLIDEEDESDSENELDVEIETICRRFITTPRTSITNFFEGVVPAYTYDEFVRFFRISRDVFQYLAEGFEKSALYQHISSQHSVTSSTKCIAVFLWFAAHECVSYRDISNLFNISLSTVFAILRRTISYVSSLAPKVIVWPNASEMALEAEYHKKKTGIPGVIGAVDGTHITIDPPKCNKDDYIDRKGNYTIAAQAVCNSRNKFISVAIGYPGSVHDARIFRTSKLPELLATAQKHFNKKFSESRVIIEHSFGIMKQRFRQLYYCKLRGNVTLCHFISACFVLHNLSKMTDLEVLGIDPFSKDPQPSGCGSKGLNESDTLDDARDATSASLEDGDTLLQDGKKDRNEICASLFAVDTQAKKRKQKSTSVANKRMRNENA